MAKDEGKKEEFEDVDLDDMDENEDAELTREQLIELRQLLLDKREEVAKRVERHLKEAIGEAENMPDEADLASRQSERAYYMRLADKESKLLRQIEYALRKFQRGTFGICEGTDEPIGMRRLSLRPWTRYSLEYKEQIERERGKSRRR